MTEMDAVVEAAQVWLEVRRGDACSGMVYHHACIALAEAVQRLNGTLDREPMAPPTAEEIERGREQVNKLIELYPAPGPGILTGSQLCGGSGQLFKRPCPGCPDCAARAQVAVQRMAEESGVPLAELPETGGHYGDWLGRPGQCDVWWDARVSKFVDWPRHLKEGAPRIRGIMRCVMALGHEPLPGAESGHNFGGLGPYTPGMPATQLQPDGTYEPVPAGPPPPRCPHRLQPAEPGHEERCQP